MLRVAILLLLAKMAFQSDLGEDYEESIYFSGNNLTLKMGEYGVDPIVRQVADLCGRAPCTFGQTCVLSQSGTYTCRFADNNDNGRTAEDHPCIPNPCTSTPNKQCFAGINWEVTGEYRCGSNPFCTSTSNTCQNGGTCVNGELCVCDGRYTGTFCERQLPPIGDSCNPSPCINGNCRRYGKSYICDCHSGYTGIICDQPVTISPCASNPCQNNGYCSSNGGSFICTCMNDYRGLKCEIPPQPVARCDPSPCFNGGTCYDYLTYQTCQCMPGFKGTTCDEVDNRCDPNPCQNGGICSDLGSDYQCSCPSGYTGSKNCDPVNRCVSNPCRNGGICNDYGSDYQCSCPSGYTGSKNCDPVNRCVPNPCLNGGTCTPSGTSYNCQCLGGYSGRDCSAPPKSMCVPNPCKSNEICYDFITYSWCKSRERRSPCETNPCQNGETCEPDDLNNGYTCKCGGKDCTIPPVGACKVNRCKNGCVCQESCRHSSGYYCKSALGYLGKNCDVAPPTVVCGNNAISLKVNAAFVREYTTDLSKFKITLFPSASPAPSECIATLSGSEYVISIPSPFTGCMSSVVQAGDGTTTVSNNLFMSLTSANGFDMPVPIVNFKCVYEKQFTITSSFQPSIEPIYPTVTSVGKSSVPASMKLCKVASCPAECDQMYGVTEGATYTVGEMIHLSISTDQTTRNLAVHEMFLSCSNSHSTSINSADVVLVSGGCAATTLTNYVPTTVSQNAVGPKVCSSFQVPKLTCPLVYIHAKLRQCQGAQVGTCASGTGQYCVTSNRRRRSAVEYDQVMGPIFIVIQNRETKAVVFPDQSIVNSTGVLNDLDDYIRILPNESNPKEAEPYISYIVYIAVTGLVFIFTLLLLSFVIRKLCALTNNQRDRF